MAIKFKFLLFSFSAPIFFGIVRYLLNQGRYGRNDILFILVYLGLLAACIRYFQQTDRIHIGLLTKKQWTQMALFLVLKIAFLCLYASIFTVSSGASSDFATRIGNGYSLSLLVGVSIFSPIEEELVFRASLQNGVFNNSWLGVLVTSLIFAFLHEPKDAISFIYYMIASTIYSISYKFTDNLSVPILCHIGNNSFVVLSSLL